jgi:hypothetical protein
MRRVTLMLAAVAMIVSLFAVVAYAAEIQGSDLDDTITETQRNDQIAGHRGDDNIDAAAFDIADTPGGDGDVDHVKGNRGEDFIDVADGDNDDTANGGRNDDVCVADAGDKVVNCD